MQRSLTGKRLTADTGILRLMDDLGRALSGSRKKYMLGGGNPAIIPEVARVWRDRMRALLDDETQFDRIVGQYDTPQGRPTFLRAVAAMLRREFGWPIGEENIAVTNGSQSAFFMLFTLLAGESERGGARRILFPLMPEYIGYADQAIRPTDFRACLPSIETIDEHTHKYHIDFDALCVDDDVAAICVSRPTNPTGNVLTNEEIARLDELARAHDVPFIIDNAYGTPVPDIIFSEAEPVWNENVVLSMSLSKIGLPSLRTGIIIARPEIIERIGAMNAVLALASGSVGQALTEDLFESGEILRISKEVVQPFYRRKRDHAVACIERSFGDHFPWSIHRPEGSLFLWVWFRDLPGTTVELYERLMERDVVVVPGKYFAFGGAEGWEHADRCIRLNYAMDDDDVERGIEIIAEEARRMWS